ncbi:cellulose binding domain-containing protein [Luedemannella helvata]|uniref:CBM2 domain-containing protein n=1 Tax=Luedemannella helvata TaxID=349315 RepID=A0ABP4W8R3_9ACTN
MRKRSALQALLAALVLALGYLVVQAAVSAPAASAAAPVRIMPLGDSITGNPGCWRALLWNKLINAGYTNIDFVGTQAPQGCGVTHDGDNEGHGGYLVTNVANQNMLPAWLAATTPDIVVMHFGTNDVWSNIAPSTILAAFSTLVDQMRASNPTMKILVAQIIPVAPSTCGDCPARTTAFNNAIPAWAASKTTAQSPITVVDQATGWVPATDTYDGVHPSDPAGITKMADKWYAPLAAALGGVTPTSALVTSRPPTSAVVTSRPPTSAVVTSRPPTSAVVTSRPPTSAVVTSRPPTSAVVTSRPPTSAAVTTGGPAGACSATYTIVGQWPGGFQGEVTVKAGPSAISRWTTSWTYASGQTITQSWSATLTSSGATVTASNAAWNGSLPAGATTTFGFIGTWNGTNSVPTVSCS